MAAGDASRNDNSVHLRGAELPRFPATCPACGQGADTPLRIERVFVRENDDESRTRSHEVVEFDVPFCPVCARAHGMQQQRPSPWLPLRRLISDGTGIGGLIVIGAGCFFFFEGLKLFSWVPIAFSAFPFLTGGWLLRKSWAATRHQAVLPATPITATVDYTDGLSQECEPFWRTFRFRNAAYAAQFRAVNQERLWDPHGAEAHAARVRREHRKATRLRIGVAVVVALGAWYVWDEWLRSIWAEFQIRRNSR